MVVLPDVVFFLESLRDINSVNARDAETDFVPLGDPALLGHHDADHADEVRALLVVLATVGALAMLAGPLRLVHYQLAVHACAHVSQVCWHISRHFC